MTRVNLLARSTTTPIPASFDVADKADKIDTNAKKDTMAKDSSLGNLLVGNLANIAMPPSPVGELRLYFDDKSLSDLWILVNWSE